MNSRSVTLQVNRISQQLQITYCALRRGIVRCIGQDVTGANASTKLGDEKLKQHIRA